MLPYRINAAFIEKEQLIENIEICSSNIAIYLNSNRKLRDFNILVNDIKTIISYWTGFNYVGIKKEKEVEDAYQIFFVSLHKLLLFFRGNKCKYFEKIFSKKHLYQGIVYRYLGYYHDDNASPVRIEYSKTYVSWSKKKNNNYLQSKFRGVITLLTCDINGNYYGIDLNNLTNDTGNEKEVVFPTIKDTIICEEFI